MSRTDRMLDALTASHEAQNVISTIEDTIHDIVRENTHPTRQPARRYDVECAFGTFMETIHRIIMDEADDEPEEA